MTALERKIFSWIEQYKEQLYFVILSVFGLILRWCCKDYVSGDASVYLLKWYREIKEGGGFAALDNQVGDYNIPYQILICLMTYIPAEPLYLFKGLSILFDYILAGAVFGFVRDLNKDKSSWIPLFAYAVVLFLPTVILNSSVWGQCDAIYAAFCVLAVWMLYRKKFTASFVFLGFAFSFKLQAVFILPFFIFYYVQEKNYSIFMYLWIFVINYLVCIPAFLVGRSHRDLFRIYFGQTKSYSDMWANFPSFWVLIGNDDKTLHYPAIFLTIALLGSMLLLLMERKTDLAEKKNFILLLTWSIWTCVLFLPSMHERYAYLLDLALLILTFVDRKYAGYFALSESISCFTYGRYLYNRMDEIDLVPLSVAYTIGYAVFTFSLVRNLVPFHKKQEMAVKKESCS